MKMIRFYFLISLLISFQALGMQDVEMARSRKAMMKPDLLTPLSPEEFTPTNVKFKRLTNHFHYDMDLKYFYTMFLLNNNKIVDGLEEYSQFILSGTATPDQTVGFMKLLQTNQTPEISQCLQEIDECILNPASYAKSRHLIEGIKNPQSPQGMRELNKKIAASIKENALFVLKSFKTQSDNLHDATLRVIVNTLDAKDMSGTSSTLVGELYTQNEEQASPLLKEYYAFRCMIKEKKFAKAISLYESILGDDLNPDNPYQKGVNYNKLAVSYYATIAKPVSKEAPDGTVNFEHSEEDIKKLMRAVDLLDTAILLSNDEAPNPVILKNLACFQIHLNRYDEALNNLKDVMSTPVKILNDYKVKRKVVKQWYELILQKTGKTEELTEILLKKQEKAIKRNKKIADLIKEEQERYKKEQDYQNELKRQQLARKEAHKSSQLIDSPRNEVNEVTTYKAVEIVDKSEQTSIKKEKKKTRGEARKDLSVPISQPKKERPLIHIERLTNNKNAQRTFNKLFEKYDGGVRSDSNVKISLNEMRFFFDAINQDYDSSKGKGSHKKVTLNFPLLEGETDIDMEEEMVILTNKTYLKPEQIKAVRQAFINKRIVPNDSQIIQKLKQEGHL